MATISTEYLSCNQICCGTLPAAVILCVPSVITTTPICQDGSGSDEPVDQTIERSFIYATVSLESSTFNGCQNIWRYVFTYDDAQIVAGATLTGSAISGVICEDCLTEWVKELVGSEPYIRTNEDGSKDFISPHGCVYRISDGP